MRVASLKRVGLCWLGHSAPDGVAQPLREQTRVMQYPPAVTPIKISALLPGAMLTSKSGERLDRPQPGVGVINNYSALV